MAMKFDLRKQIYTDSKAQQEEISILELQTLNVCTWSMFQFLSNYLHTEDKLLMLDKVCFVAECLITAALTKRRPLCSHMTILKVW